jgi:nucleotide-binding universal stress UspA family protein
VVVRDETPADETPAAGRLVGVGAGDLDDCAGPLAFAFEEAALRQASLVVIHAWHAPQAGLSRTGNLYPPLARHVAAADARRELALLLERWQEKYPGVPVSQDVVPGHPGRALAGLSARADLVVIGRRPGLPGSGSVRHAVLSHAHGPVAVVPSS